jgi:hypothetical protein
MSVNNPALVACSDFNVVDGALEGLVIEEREDSLGSENEGGIEGHK